MIKVHINRKDGSSVDLYTDDAFPAIQGMLAAVKGADEFITGWADSKRQKLLAVSKDTIADFYVHASSTEIDKLVEKYNKELDDAQKKQQARSQLAVPNSMKGGQA